MTFSTKETVRISWKFRSEGQKALYYRQTTNKHPTLKEVQEKKYLFPLLDLLIMLDDLLKNKMIKLSKSKQSEETGRTYNPMYYRYYRFISHPLEICITLKECIMYWLRIKNGC